MTEAATLEWCVFHHDFYASDADRCATVDTMLAQGYWTAPDGKCERGEVDPVAARLARLEAKVDALDAFLRETIAGITGGIEAVMGNGLIGRVLGRGRGE